MAPFGVGGFEVVTAGVNTMGQTPFGDFKLPDESLYRPVPAAIATRAQGHGHGHGNQMMRAAVYAPTVVNEIVKGPMGCFWYSENADQIKMSTTTAEKPWSEMVRRIHHLVTTLTEYRRNSESEFKPSL
ncbi:hypothetical protein F5Y15DRAFT_370096 [Xylariaceae sp. FL0016]|nr:hypothetical protein F5Y15DRAFT_370096 [Xylariaceae sp. FL0016]